MKTVAIDPSHQFSALMLLNSTSDVKHRANEKHCFLGLPAHKTSGSELRNCDGMAKKHELKHARSAVARLIDDVDFNGSLRAIPQKKQRKIRTPTNKRTAISPFATHSLAGASGLYSQRALKKLPINRSRSRKTSNI
jgi:hypothetical protein